MATPESIPVERLSEDAVLPSRAHPTDAGLDLAATEDAVLAPGGRAAIGTGLALAVPDGHAGLILPRSGRALREGLTVANAPGLIDSGYRGEIKVILVNLGDAPVTIAVGERIAQLVVTPVLLAATTFVDTLPAHDGRGEGGFGSSGS